MDVPNDELRTAAQRRRPVQEHHSTEEPRLVGVQRELDAALQVFQLGRVLPRERQQPPRHGCGAPACIVYFLQHLPDKVIRREFIGRDFAVAEDHRQHGIEVVRDSAGQHAY